MFCLVTALSIFFNKEIESCEKLYNHCMQQLFTTKQRCWATKNSGHSFAISIRTFRNTIIRLGDAIFSVLVFLFWSWTCRFFFVEKNHFTVGVTGALHTKSDDCLFGVDIPLSGLLLIPIPSPILSFIFWYDFDVELHIFFHRCAHCLNNVLPFPIFRTKIYISNVKRATVAL